MLMIRKEQMEVLSRYMVDQFVKRMKARLRRDFAAQIAGSTDEQIEAVIHKAIASGRQYALELEWEIEKLLEVMMALGTGFEINPETSWAREILNKKQRQSSTRFDEIFARLKHH